MPKGKIGASNLQKRSQDKKGAEQHERMASMKQALKAIFDSAAVIKGPKHTQVSDILGSERTPQPTQAGLMPHKAPQIQLPAPPPVCAAAAAAAAASATPEQTADRHAQASIF